MNLRDPIVYGEYIDDGANAYKVKITTSVATAGGFNIIPFDQLPNFQKWRGGRRTMRGVTIKTTDNRYHDFLPIASFGNPLFNNGGTVNGIGGRDGWVATGKSGENKRF